MPFTIENRVGRLVEARVFGLTDAAAVADYASALKVAFTPLVDKTAVLLADHRPVVIYAPDVADKLTSLFRGFNATLARAALVSAPTNATLNMQLGRLVREADNPWRRLFTDVADATTFLEDILTAEERKRAHAFLASFSPPPR